MLTLTKSLFALMIGFIAATFFGLIVIPFFCLKIYYILYFHSYFYCPAFCLTVPLASYLLRPFHYTALQNICNPKMGEVSYRVYAIGTG